jgi:hypothetical protein
MPNGAGLESRHTCQLNVPALPSAARDNHILPGLASHSLLSIANFCDNGCDVISPASTVMSTTMARSSSRDLATLGQIYGYYHCVRHHHLFPPQAPSHKLDAMPIKPPPKRSCSNTSMHAHSVQCRPLGRRPLQTTNSSHGLA